MTPKPEPEPRVGLRLRLWLGCLAGGAVAGLGSLWVMGTRVAPGAVDPALLLAWLSGVAFVAVLAGLVLAAWLDHHVVGQLRILARALRTGRVSELRGLPSAGGWGELGDLAEEVQAVLTRLRAAGHAAEEIEQLRGQLAALQLAADRWVATEQWEAPAIPTGALAELNDTLARGFARRGVVDDQNREAAQQVAGELTAAIADAQESATQAERGFVEATAMLTTVRELQRLSGELQHALDQLGAGLAAPADAADASNAQRAQRAQAAREALEELVDASQEAVEAIGRAMLRVHDVSAQVQTLSNRATLVAIQAVSSPLREGADPAGEQAGELKQLALEVRAITDRTASFADDIEMAVGDATHAMAVARQRALERLEAATAAAPEAPAAPGAGRERAYDDAQRLLERVREMVQDAARKGERLSAAGERTSRAAERLSRRIESESAEASALRVRLEPVGDAAAEPTPAPATRAGLKLIPIETDADAASPDARSREEEGRP
ncbi:MAG: hypothetical protein U0704_03335 [Candidatus Eisenbacteria bacterium]